MADAKTKRSPALIGPNAILQTANVLDRHLGEDWRKELMAEAGLVRLPDGEHMIDEEDALALHHAIALELPRAEARDIAIESGYATADYIIANRIPLAAQRLLGWLPPALSAKLLMWAISKHAWTFIGAGRFIPQGGWRFSIDRSEANDRLSPPPSLFAWYGAVFTRLFQQLVDPSCECVGEPSSKASGSLRHKYGIERALRPVRRRKMAETEGFEPSIPL